ncbi:hypothetical protein [Lactiplantibacillus songbeiensis]|uniref:Siderophore/Surfactin synthetase related protein n=1 Tax=Lactiplantibacillus songbeiensis TaxID=2559920 RepID=A0ABW4C0D7_9LACO|nr:hypothetical protein [Lactiplantibacillus songbeiensis]
MYYRGEVLDFVNMLMTDTTVPLMRSRIVFSSKIDVERLKAAVLASAQIVPEIFAQYQADHNRFEVTSQQVDDLVVEAQSPYSPENFAFNLTTGPQLQLFVIHHDQYDVLQAYMSHLLTDGVGFKEYLYLLAQAYNHDDLAAISNERRLRPVITKLQRQFHRPRAHADLPLNTVQLPHYQGINLRHIGHIMLTSKQFMRVRQVAKAQDVGISEAILAAYAKALQVLTGHTTITLPCPINFRHFTTAEANVTRIANLTGTVYLNIKVDVDAPFTALVQHVHDLLATERAHAAFLYRLTNLQKMNHAMPVGVMRKMANRWLAHQPLTYTNFGVVDQEKLQFHGLNVVNCVFSGAFRPTPAMEIAASTFAGTCTLSFNSIGSERDYQLGMKILENIQAQLLVWSQTAIVANKLSATTEEK